MVYESNGLRAMVGCALALWLLLTPSLALTSGCGGGGGGGGGGGVDGAVDLFGGSRATNIQPWTADELNVIFEHTSPSQQPSLVAAFTGSTIAKRDLLTIRQVFLEANAVDARHDAALLDSCVKTLEVLDKLGEITQEGLSFVPGVGWVTAASLGAARGGANAYRDGLDHAEIAKGVVFGGTASALVGKFSPANADAAFNTAKAGVNLARNAVSQEVKTRALGLAARAAKRYGLKKGAEYGAEKGIGMAMETLADYVGAPNMAQQPNYTQTLNYDPLSSAPASSVTGGPAQF
ncbi:MAG: hypothetical protein ABIK45_03510 [Pseudomonadota bacterium]